MTSSRDAKALVMRVFASLRPDADVRLEWRDSITCQAPIPSCPRHPGAHPLVAALDAHHAAVWRCPATGEAIGRI